MWWELACLLLVVYSVASTARSYWRLRHFKGPRLAAFSQLWYIRAAISEKAHLYLSDVCTEYGAYFRALISARSMTDATSARIYCSDWSQHPRHLR